jgi:sulfotransferase
MKNLFFNASLPRSGGTLLQNVLAQNSEMYVSSTSILLDFMSTAKDSFVHKMQYVHPDQANINKEAFLEFCRVGMSAYADAFTGKTCYLDKHFAWMHYYSFLEHILIDEQPRIIVMVRDLRDIVCSFEENYRTDPLKHNMHVNWSTLENTSMQKRVETWLNSSPLGTSLEHIKDVKNFHQDVLFIRYEDFCTNPLPEMAKIYNYLEIPFYLHDFTNVEQVTQHNDILHFANHDVDSKVEQKQSRAIDVLGEEICNQIYNQYNWYFKLFNYDTGSDN